MAAISFSHRMYSSSVICSCSSTTGSVSSVEEIIRSNSPISSMPPTRQRSRKRSHKASSPCPWAGSSLEAAISLSEEHGWKTVRYGIFFIDNGEQCILNGRSGFPYLVQESNGGRRQITIDNTLIRIFVFQFGNWRQGRIFRPAY